MSVLLTALRRHRSTYLSLVDVGCWFAAVFAFSFLRYLLSGVSLGEAVSRTPWSGALLIATLAASLHIVLGLAVRLHQGRSAIGSLDEMMALGPVVSATGLVVTMLNLGAGRPVPGTAPLAAAAGALVLMAWYRASYRSLIERQVPWPGVASHAVDLRSPVVIFGAGEAGRQLVCSMLRDPRSPYVPVALLDDDRAKRHRRIRGIAVMGGRDQLGDVAEQTNARAVVIAIPSASAEDVRTINERAVDVGLDVKVLPSTAELLDPDQAVVEDVRDVDVTDLLGRHQIDTDIDSIAGYLTGKRVLVTGAGGSIGSELCRQIARFSPAELIMLDRDESALHAVELSIYGRALLDSDDVVLADIRDNLHIDALFEERKPHVVFHAAALKHLPMLEQYPGEAVKTNVWGTLTILESARAHGVERFVNISTDKAANPCSVLGYSKRLAEGLTAAVAEEADGTYLSVRFGNVLGSRGSVLTAFHSQIASGGPVTVTDPDVTRYFMTVQEAVQLVVQAAAIGKDGEVLVLDMGDPVSIDGVARQLIEMSGKDIEITYTGLREGEKLHEELWGDDEPDLRPVHPRVSHSPVPALNALYARELDPWAERQNVVKQFVEATNWMAAGRGRSFG